MAQTVRDAEVKNNCYNGSVGSWTETGAGVALAIAAQPIHEGGHAIAARVLTGLWPHFGFWAVYPTAQFSSKPDALIVLAAGDGAVLVWWVFVFLLVRRRPISTSALVGPTFVLAVVLLNWMVAALFFPFGRANLAGSDAFKFLAISGWAPLGFAAVLIGIAGAVVMLTTRCFRTALSDARTKH